MDELSNGPVARSRDVAQSASHLILVRKACRHRRAAFCPAPFQDDLDPTAARIPVPVPIPVIGIREGAIP